MTVLIHDRHGKSWDFNDGITVRPANDANADLVVLDLEGNQVGGFNQAAWSHYKVEDDSVGVKAHLSRLLDLALAVGSKSAGLDGFDNDSVDALLTAVFWTTDQIL